MQMIDKGHRNANWRDLIIGLVLVFGVPVCLFLFSCSQKYDEDVVEKDWVGLFWVMWIFSWAIPLLPLGLATIRSSLRNNRQDM